MEAIPRLVGIRGAGVLLALAIVGCGRPPAGPPDIEGVDKPVMRRGVKLEAEIDRFLGAGYVLLAQRGYTVESFAQGASRSKGDARKLGGQLIVLYENLDPADVHRIAVPLFIAESYFDPGAMRAVLASVEAAPVVAFFWARPNRPMALGAYFRANPPAERPAGLEQPAVQIQVVVRRSPAALGYLLKDDWVTHLDGQAVSGDPSGLVERLSARRGQTVEITVLRDGDPQVKQVTLNP